MSGNETETIVSWWIMKGWHFQLLSPRGYWVEFIPPEALDKSTALWWSEWLYPLPPPPKFICCILTLNVMVLEGGVLGVMDQVMRVEPSWDLMLLYERLLPPCEDTGEVVTWKRAPIWSRWHPDIELLASRTVRYKFLLFSGVGNSSPNGPRHPWLASRASRAGAGLCVIRSDGKTLESAQAVPAMGRMNSFLLGNEHRAGPRPGQSAALPIRDTGPQAIGGLCVPRLDEESVPSHTGCWWEAGGRRAESLGSATRSGAPHTA